MKEEPATDAKCKDKFLVQSVAVTKDMEFANVTSIVRFRKSLEHLYSLLTSVTVREGFQVRRSRAQDSRRLAGPRLGCEERSMS